MGEFRIGRTFARHSYPDTPRGGGLAALANNEAFGPGTNQPIATLASGLFTPAFTNTNGSSVSAGALTAQGVPITPQATGDVTIEAMINVLNTNEAAAINIFVFLQINGVTSSAPISATTLDAGGYEAIPVTFGPTELQIGQTAHINLLVVASAANALLTTANGTGTITAASAMILQEIAPPTG